MPQGDKQDSSSEVGSPPATAGTNPSVLADVTNSASSRSPKASSKSPPILHNQPSDAPFSFALTLLVTSGDSPIPAHMASLGNTADNPTEINDSTSKAVFSNGDHHASDGKSSSDDSTSSSSDSGSKSSSGSTTSGSGSYTANSASAVITDGDSQSSYDSGSLISSPVSKCTRHKQKSSGRCHPSSTSCSWTLTTTSQAITIVDDKDQSLSPKHHNESHTYKKHKKCEHNSPSHSLSPEKQRSSHSSRKKSSSKAASAACKGSLTSKSPVSAQSVIIPSTSGTASSKVCKASGGPVCL